ncbi:3-oxoacyl-ACP synthase III family protein [Burkholderia latens]|uniref:3-oxoacyl-ACP synthase n=1 Tax=Burkholderia latens TaxID=488446 RepID=A0A6H9SXW0_9BURK|nr:beta-ketoacyl-ACP synthase 3 [Burkholderia latens]KAB0644783.1 beta-ketoacyl-ACP synthase 3 [Burkholderia latens]VWB17611.1 3-oxoacyl-ACP synthase [Burkholderia latens]
MNGTQREVRIAGIGIALPERVVTNEELAITAGVNPSWATEKLGISGRRICGPSEHTSDLAATSARNAIDDSGLSDDDIDLVIVATATPDRRAPSTACLTLNKLGIDGVPAFDLSAVCSGFLFAMVTASQFVKSGMYENVLVIGADTFSKVTDWTRRDCVYFGDGSGAVVVQATWDSGAKFDALMSTGVEGVENFTIPTGQGYFEMAGGPVFESASTMVPKLIGSLLERSGLCPDDVDSVIPHQPSVHLLRRIAELSGLDFGKFHLSMDRLANTAGATIPIALWEARQAGRLKVGDLILFASAGAGMTAGAALMRWS